MIEVGSIVHDHYRSFEVIKKINDTYIVIKPITPDMWESISDMVYYVHIDSVIETIKTIELKEKNNGTETNG